MRFRRPAALVPLACVIALLAIPARVCAGPDGMAPATNVPAPRADLSELIQWRLLFSESALDLSLEEQPRRDLFTLEESTYVRSGVILDVYEQTHKAVDKTGGYMISVFRAR